MILHKLEELILFNIYLIILNILKSKKGQKFNHFSVIKILFIVCFCLNVKSFPAYKMTPNSYGKVLVEHSIHEVR